MSWTWDVGGCSASVHSREYPLWKWFLSILSQSMLIGTLFRPCNYTMESSSEGGFSLSGTWKWRAACRTVWIWDSFRADIANRTLPSFLIWIMGLGRPFFKWFKWFNWLKTRKKKKKIAGSAPLGGQIRCKNPARRALSPKTKGRILSPTLPMGKANDQSLY